MSMNRKRGGSPGGILDQIEPGGARSSPVFDLDARWLVAGGVLIIALVGTVAGITYMNVSTGRLLPKAEGPRPKVAAAPRQDAPPSARIERVDAMPAPAPIGFEQAPSAATTTALAHAAPVPDEAHAAGDTTPEPATATALAASTALTPPAVARTARARTKPAARTVVQRSARRLPASERAKPRAAPAPAAPEADPDVELISALRKATESVAD